MIEATAFKPDDVRKAEKRLRRCYAGEDVRDVYDDRINSGAGQSGVLIDRALLSDVYLAEHPEDDLEPVAEGWVKQVLPANVSGPVEQPSALYQGLAAVVSWIRWPNSGLCVYVGAEDIAWRMMTRRQFRQLLAGLGIEVERKV